MPTTAGSSRTLAELMAGPQGARAPRIALVAGEASGDALGAGLIAQLRQRHPEARFAGIGGPGMRAAGLDAWFDASELAVMGLTEVLRHLPRLLRLRKSLRQQLLDWQPDVFIGIDAPDFNLGMERWLKQRGVPTVHYVSPSVWAWREKRADGIGRSADLVLCLFPMEPDIYARHGVDARYVGHPMADALSLQPDREAARAALGLGTRPVLAVLPGSRMGEVGRLAQDFIDAALRVAEQVPGLQVLIPAANRAVHAVLEPLLAATPFPSPRPRLLDGQAREAMVASDVVLLASGTATLEAMLAKRAMVVGYKVAPASAWLARRLRLLKVKRFALPNILAGEDLAPELMQEDCTPDRLAAAVLEWFAHPEAVAALQGRYLELHALLRQDASARAADAVDELLRDRGPGTRDPEQQA
ncbi:lipid-A-disaccharide synthase [Pseudoxanthomonas winnipegensis]|jgi:lipid-A-disaccharide synthase|uniref:Lipid-A-disaccharide synthase n=1 Tax=Pseudoxanthomonas winnipegensis TaxID=2480810 RepID=A0ABY1WGD3_9GAMM|nr:lipid-A-disaccharide synthase [Pseudoxanthomonas winnipegensis]TAA08014.1 lipid-A-disaccharide synthase [Pseudoxanthomonas winnipegensis]TAA21006.1 lipid-A-disaccharide synthase [Pseudoxanthomonas winnipegensis]TAH72475.1 lipid-A-disaccharide synthase [Pseudoxanthomonas winnipegensis]